MTPIQDYKIVKGLPEKVEQQVKELLADGWSINGTMSTMTVDRYTICVQCMVKLPEPELKITGDHVASDGGRVLLT